MQFVVCSHPANFVGWVEALRNPPSSLLLALVGLGRKASLDPPYMKALPSGSSHPANEAPDQEWQRDDNGYGEDGEQHHERGERQTLLLVSS